MDEESHDIPLAPRNFHPRSDEETNIHKPPKFDHTKSSKFFVYLLLIIVIQSIAFLIFGMVVLRIAYPHVTIQQVEIKNLKYETAQAQSLSMNVTARLTIQNTNFGGFKFGNSSVGFMYGNGTFGVTNIKGGIVKGRKSKSMDVMVQFGANGLPDYYSNFTGDLNSGIVELSSYANIRGEIRVLKIFIKKRTSIMSCSMSLNLKSQLVQNLLCK